MHDTVCARAPRTQSLAATGDGAVNCFGFALDEVTGYKVKAECDILNAIFFFQYYAPITLSI